MPAIVISAVNTGTDELTAVGHGLLTGDRMRLRNVGGALPAATPALAATTDYFAVRTGADTLKLSDTNAHALAGTNIVDLTGSGSGTNIIEYGLPYCLPTALAAPGGQIKSANETGAWQSLVALYDLLTGQIQAIWSAIVIAMDVTLAANHHFTVSGTGDYKHGDRVLVIPGCAATAVPNTSFTTNLGKVASTALADIPVALPLREGDRIKSVTVARFGDGAVDIGFSVFATTTAGSSTQIGGPVSVINAVAAWTDTTISVTPTTLSSGVCLHLSMSPQDTGATFNNIRVTYDRP